MKKILISHIPNTLNYGSAMMAINLINGMRNRLEEGIEIYCDCDEYHLNRLKEATGDESIKGFLKPLEIEGSRIKKITDIIFGKDDMSNTIRNNFDAMIVLGGDDLSETKMRYAIFLGLLYNKINAKCKVILAGQSLGPFSGLYKTIGKFLFRNLVLITRDDNSYEFSKNELGVRTILKSRDLALLDLPKQEAFNDILITEKLTDQKYIVLVPSGLVIRYTHDTEGYIETWYTIFKKLKEKYPDRKIVLLSHVLQGKGSNDTDSIDKLLRLLNGEEKEDTIVYREPMQPAEARAILGNSDFVISGRMHAAVSSFFMNKPAITLAYSEKYYGVIGRGLELPELIVESRNRSWGENSDIVKEIMQKSELVVDSYEELRGKIKKLVSQNSELVDNQISFICEQLR